MRAFRFLIAVVTVCLASVGAGGSPAWAHNSLLNAAPGDGASLEVAPTKVVLDFAERLDPRFTTIAVTTSTRETVNSGGVQVTRSRAVQPVQPSLPPGDYTVAYRVVSVDGHPVQGSFTFSVASVPTTAAAEAAGSPAPASDPTVSAGPANLSDSAAVPASTGSRSATIGVWVAVAVVSGLGMGFAFWLRRRAAR